MNRMTVESWKGDKLDWNHIEACRQRGVTRFKDTLDHLVDELRSRMPSALVGTFSGAGGT